MRFRPHKDERSRHLDPAQEAPAGALQPAGAPTELGAKGMTPFHRIADFPYPGLPRTAPLGSLHAEARRVRPGWRGTIALRPLGPGTWQVPRVRVGHGGFGRRWLHHQRLQHPLGLHAVVGTGLGDERPQRQAVFGRGQVDGRTGLGTIHRARSRIRAAFLGRLRGAIDQDLVPVDAVQLLVAFGQPLPGLMEAVVFQPEAQALLDRVGTGETRRDLLPADPRDEDLE